MNSFTFSRELAAVRSYDVVVCGGGPSGVAAALAARRQGLTVLLVEGTGQLGGTGTSGGVASLLGGRTRDNKHACVGGIFAEVSTQLIKRGAAVDPLTIPNEMYQPFGWSHGDLAVGLYFEPFAMAAWLDEMMDREGVEVLYFTQFVDVRLNADKIDHLILFNKTGLFAVSTRAVIDTTGDGDVAARSGCRFALGRESDGLMTPASLIFFVEQVDQATLTDYIREHQSPRLREIIERLRAQGEWPFPFDIFISMQTPQPGTFMINTSRICDVDGTDGWSVSKGMQEGRRQVQELFRLMRAHFPGFARARIKEIAPTLGVRETRRIQGEYFYTVADVLAKKDFTDTIGYSGYNFDLPDPKKPSDQPIAEKVALPRLVTPIPYAVMVPKPVTNLICAGRSISVERDVLGILRVMAPCYAMGEAAGVASKWVVQKDVAYRDVPCDALRQTLSLQGAIVDWPHS